MWPGRWAASWQRPERFDDGAVVNTSDPRETRDRVADIPGAVAERHQDPEQDHGLIRSVLVLPHGLQDVLCRSIFRRPKVDKEAVAARADADHGAGGQLGPIGARIPVRRLLEAAFDQV